MTETMHISNLKGWDKNPRGIKKDAFERLKRQITAHGQFKPVLVTADGEVIGGNMRLKAYQALGITDVWVSVVTPKDETEKIAIALADNDRAGYYEEDALAELIMSVPDLVLEDYHLDLGKTISAKDLLDKFRPTEEDDFDVEAELPDEPVSKLGDVYQLGNHRLMCGDSTDADAVGKLMDGAKADMVFTDPPYGIDFTSQDGKSIKNDNLNLEQLKVFNALWQKIAYEFASKDCFMMVWQSPRLFYLMNMFGEWTFFRLITMYKSNRISYPHGAWINKSEPCLIFTKGNPKPTGNKYLDDCYVYVHDKESHQDSNVGHPTPKPVKMVVENIIACVVEKSNVLDFFGGSGSTLIACEQSNRICYMMELDPKYCDVIIKRWEQFTGEKAIQLTEKEQKNGQ